MFVLQYNYNDYELLLNDIARQLSVQPEKGILKIPSNAGSGYLRCMKLPNGLQVNIIDAVLNQHWWIHRIKSHEEFYTLRFDEMEIKDELTIAIDKEEKQAGLKKMGSAYLTSSLFDWYYIGSKGLHFKGVNILFTKEWMAKYLGLSNTEDVLTTYLSIKTDRLELEPLDDEYKKIINEILNDDPDNPFPVLSLQNKLLILIERFFARLFEKHKSSKFSVNINTDEMERLQNVESILVKSFNGPPPSIPQLAKVAAMSPTKLKKLFKAVYGNAIFEYFQKRRMKHAAELLLTRKYSVKEVGNRLGYANMSNFTLAFKKEFNRLPSEF